MSEQPRTGVARAADEVSVAQTLIDNGLPSQAIARLFVAARSAAEEVLARLDTVASSDSGTVALFVRLAVHESTVDPHAGRLLRLLYDQQVAADQAAEWADDDDADRAMEDARRFVALVRDWLNNPRGSGTRHESSQDC